MHAPALDHYRFTRGTPKEQQAYAAELIQALKAHSFVKIVNHGLDDPTIEALFTRVCVLWSLTPLLFFLSSDAETTLTYLLFMG